MNESDLADLCISAAYLANSVQLRAMLILRAVISVVSFVLVYLLCRSQGSYLAFHPNARILLIAHHVWLFLLCVTDLIPSVFQLILFSGKYNDSCDYLMTTTVSVIVRGPSLITMYGPVFALLAMALERFVATITFRTYEARKQTLGNCLVVVQVRNEVDEAANCIVIGVTGYTPATPPPPPLVQSSV
jgi:hypothetical protein